MATADVSRCGAAGCGATIGLATCSGCRSVAYCRPPAECQRVAWRAGHKLECKERARDARFCAGADGGDDSLIWAQPLDAIKACQPALIPFEPILGVGAATYTQYIWWHGGITPSAALGARFRAAHAAVRSASGGSAVQTAVEQEMLSSSTILGLPSAKKGVMDFPFRVMMWMLGVRFAVTPLSARIVRDIVRLANRICRTPVGGPAIDCSVAGVLPSQAVPFEDVGSPSARVLNTLRHSAAYVFCVGAAPEDDVVVVTSVGDLDEAAFERATSMTTTTLSRSQQCISRLVCFFCGAHPCSRGVKLASCAGCDAVAYCSQSCASSDWVGEHHRECARVNTRTHAVHGFTALPALDLQSPFRGETEVMHKRVSFSIPFAVLPAGRGMWAPPSLSCTVLKPSHAPGAQAAVPVRAFKM